MTHIPAVSRGIPETETYDRVAWDLTEKLLKSNGLLPPLHVNALYQTIETCRSLRRNIVIAQ